MRQPSPSSNALATLSMSLTAGAALSLMALHWLSSELEPAWHMVSEYAYGNHGHVLTVFFCCWGLGAIAFGASSFPLAAKWQHKLGVGLVVASGVGALGGGLFDVRHPLHGLAFGVGVPTLPIGALLLSGCLAQLAPKARLGLRLLAHATWVSVLGMAVSMALFIASLKAAGAFHPESHQVLTRLPEGVTSVSGYANRLLVLAYLSWIAFAAHAIRSAARKSDNRRACL